jgi:hypothetical protein
VPMTLCIGAPLTTDEIGWAAIVGLRDRARAWIAGESGEPAVSRGAVMVDAPAAEP